MDRAQILSHDSRMFGPMRFEQGKYYHIYNRTNNRERLFRSDANRRYLLRKVRGLMMPHCTVIAYVLMPNHFHLLVRCETEDGLELSKAIGVMLRSYTRGINQEWRRTGNLFQQNTKAKEVGDERYLLTVISYIHQNPLRAKIVSGLDDWLFSSYPVITERKDALDLVPIDMALYRRLFPTTKEFVEFSRNTVRSVRREYWV